MLGKQRIHNLSVGNCDKTFKNLLRGKEKLLSPQKEYMLTQVKEANVSPRAEKNYAKFWNKNQSYNLKDINSIQHKYITNYVKGELRSQIDFKPPEKDYDDRKYTIRTMSQIQKQNPHIHKESKDDVYNKKTNSVAKIKMINDMFKNNPIVANTDINNMKNRPKKDKYYLDSTLIKSNFENPRLENTVTPAKKCDNADFEGKMLFQQSRAVNNGEKKFLKNSNHLVSGKTGYYM